MLVNLLIAAVLLLFLAWIYRAWRAALQDPPDRKELDTDERSIARSSSSDVIKLSWLQRVPKVFTQPHLNSHAHERPRSNYEPDSKTAGITSNLSGLSSQQSKVTRSSMSGTAEGGSTPSPLPTPLQASESISATPASQEPTMQEHRTTEGTSQSVDTYDAAAINNNTSSSGIDQGPDKHDSKRSSETSESSDSAKAATTTATTSSAAYDTAVARASAEVRASLKETRNPGKAAATDAALPDVRSHQASASAGSAPTAYSDSSHSESVLPQDSSVSNNANQAYAARAESSARSNATPLTGLGTQGDRTTIGDTNIKRSHDSDDIQVASQAQSSPNRPGIEKLNYPIAPGAKGTPAQPLPATSQRVTGHNSTELQRTDGETDELRSRNELLEKQLKSAEQDIQQQLDQISSLRDKELKMASLQNQVNELEQTARSTTQLQEELKALQAAAEHTQQLQSEVDLLRRRASSAESGLPVSDSSATDDGNAQTLQEQLAKTPWANAASGGDQSSTVSDQQKQEALELRRLNAELSGKQQQNEKYLQQIRDLEAQLRDQQRSQASAATGVQRGSVQNSPSTAANLTNSGHTEKPKPQPLFTRPNESDDLKKVKGIGPVMERTLNDLGVTTFKQLSDFTADDVQRVSDALAVFPGRIERDAWVPQAAELYRKKQLLNS